MIKAATSEELPTAREIEHYCDTYALDHDVRVAMLAEAQALTDREPPRGRFQLGGAPPVRWDPQYAVWEAPLVVRPISDAFENDKTMELFNKYDADGSGQIDIDEFEDIANDMRSSANRRTILGLAAAGLSALVVAKKAEEFSFLQKNLRPVYLEAEAEAAQKRFFPGALLSSDLDAAVAATLYARGFSPKNTLFAHSVCSDEVNQKDGEIVDLMVNRWKEGFSLGGLAGLPFVGKSGFRAFLHHVPDSGRLCILFAPHVGIDGGGRVGALRRDGQRENSKACGAAVGAYKAILAQRETRKEELLQASRGSTKEVLAMPGEDEDPFDPEIETIIKLLGPRLEGIEQAPDPIAFVTYQMYAIVRDKLDSCISNTADVWDYATEVAVIGGIMINRDVGGDFFQPLSFEVRKQNSPTVDLLTTTFGSPPNLAPVLGSYGAVDKLKLYSKDRKRA